MGRNQHRGGGGKQGPNKSSISRSAILRAEANQRRLEELEIDRRATPVEENESPSISKQSRLRGERRERKKKKVSDTFSLFYAAVVSS